MSQTSEDFRSLVDYWQVMDSVKKVLSYSKVDSIIIPGGCTKYLQTPDVSWNKTFDAKVTEFYDERLSKGIHEFTGMGNLEAPPRRRIVEWVLNSWSTLSPELIKNSFKTCGLNLPANGSEDHLIHCFKEGTPCATGAEILQQLMLIRRDLSLLRTHSII